MVCHSDSCYKEGCNNLAGYCIKCWSKMSDERKDKLRQQMLKEVEAKEESEIEYRKCNKCGNIRAYKYCTKCGAKQKSSTKPIFNKLFLLIKDIF